MSEHESIDESRPQLPPGDISTLSTLSQSLSFHSSPESFISSRAKIDLSRSTTEGDDSGALSPLPPIIRARILNRNVAVVSSYQICQDVLQAGSGLPYGCIKAAIPRNVIGIDTFAVHPAYHQLMSDFFPPPNVLLTDRPDHAEKRNAWNGQLSSLPTDATSIIREIAQDHFNFWCHGGTVDIYDSMKDLSWRLLFAIFLQVSPADNEYSTIESLQETLLRGQFSLFPVTINTPFWRSPRSKGVDARKKLQRLLSERITSMDGGCPILRQGKIDDDEIASNTLLFTSSIAAKALASILTASLLNLFLFPAVPSLASRVRGEDPSNRELLLDSILLETERLSPPVIGVMRRVHQDVIFSSPEGLPPTLVPAGWDIWMYFVGAHREEGAYSLAETFLPERFTSSDTKPSLSFGTGAKTCLGRDLVRQIVRSVATSVLDLDIKLEGSVNAEGVRGWLGWKANVNPAVFARDLKQLPCQRPREAIKVRVLRDAT